MLTECPICREPATGVAQQNFMGNTFVGLPVQMRPDALLPSTKGSDDEDDDGGGDNCARRPAPSAPPIDFHVGPSSSPLDVDPLDEGSLVMTLSRGPAVGGHD
jgi:hypothetical protein